EDPNDSTEEFCMTILALKFCAFNNGVSKLHGAVSRKMWKEVFYGIPENEIPIGHVTNGVHAKSWIYPDLFNELKKTAETVNELSDFDIWQQVDNISDDCLWAIHKKKRGELILYLRDRVYKQRERRNESEGELAATRTMFNPDALTIGFARRFATYKRGYLLLYDTERLEKILCNADRPVQIILAGKAHPADQAGKDIIKVIYDLSCDSTFSNHIIFLEDYDIDLARKLVQGVDIWLNNPRRPLEASGTSGMKAALNGGINFSVLDGWWDEASTKDVGWNIGMGEEYKDAELQDRLESELFYAALERDIVPMFYDRDENDLPLAWVEKMKNSIRELGTGFNSHRMLSDYVSQCYQPAMQMKASLSADDFKAAKELASWRDQIRKHWDALSIERIEAPENDFVYKGSSMEIKAWLKLGKIQPENIIVECYHGNSDRQFEIQNANRQSMEFVETEGNLSLFRTDLHCVMGGQYGFTVRVLPGHEHLTHEFLPGYIKWADFE
ncbi:MAG: alpha-glucan family phosphorylase, partial [Lentisphaeria bacterium]|nr:alpha-glucan family phosphorylase [Lentisphaeria bacterium]NQZ68470.1 alpha-glucan family phosphorylase [Lentisphaeria bacterium]